MRVSPETRDRTRAAILAAAGEAFLQAGYSAATTRDIAAAAGIAVGTLFNYFPTKEVLGLALAAELLQAAEVELEATRRAGETLEERLFAQVAIQLRHLAPARSWVVEVLEAGLSPLRADESAGGPGELRRRHLERVSGWLREEPTLRPDRAESALELHLYWSLYLGTLGFWAQDDSAGHEATLAFLDRAMGLFCSALRQE